MNIQSKLQSYDIDENSVIEKRQFVRELIKENIVENIDATSTQSMNAQCLDDIITKAKNCYTYQSPKSNKSSSNNSSNNNQNISSILNDLQNALSGQNTNVEMDEVESIIDAKINPLKEVIKDETKTNKKIYDDFKNGIEQIETLIDSIQNSSKKTINRIKAKSSKNEIVQKLSYFYDVGSESNQNVLLLSPPSFGKSHAIRIMGNNYDHFIEHNCSDDMDENSTLIGSTITDASNSSKSGFINVDGVLTDAMRKASKEENVLIFFDECLRWNESTQSFMLTFLNGFKKNVNGKTEKWYRLTTRNNVGNSLETIEANSKYLHIVGGANLTSDIPIEAFWSRFKKVRIDYSLEFAKRTTEAIVRTYEISDDNNIEKFSEWFSSLIDETRKMVIDGSLQFACDFRFLENAIHSSNGSTTDIIKFIKSSDLGIQNDICLWDSDSGNILEDSVKALTDLFKKLTSKEV